MLNMHLERLKAKFRKSRSNREAKSNKQRRAVPIHDLVGTLHRLNEHYSCLIKKVIKEY